MVASDGAVTTYPPRRRWERRENGHDADDASRGIFGAYSIVAGAAGGGARSVAGAIVGGALGAIVGGALGRGGGAVAGAVIGATTGAVIASEAQRRSTGYYWWRGGCYYRYLNGSWLQVQRGYCAY